MIRRVGMTAGMLRGREFHEFNTADFRAVKFLQSILAKLLGGRANVFDAERKIILDAELLVVGVRGNIEHVLYPVVAIGSLDFIPVERVVLEAALPIQTEAEKIEMEVIFDCPVFHHEASVEDSHVERVSE